MPTRKAVLIVEDDIDLRLLYRTALSWNGFDVREAPDGIAALVEIEQHRPDLVVLDLGLPRLGGLSVQQELAAHVQTRRIPIVVVTGSTENLADIPVDCVLKKPATPERLVEVVQTCLASAARAPAL
jgi:DNA-binding response OmpR family regulator